jgi:hypothetical protein
VGDDGACYHELGTAYVFCALDYVVQVIFVGLFSMVFTAENGVA